MKTLQLTIILMVLTNIVEEAPTNFNDVIESSCRTPSKNGFKYTLDRCDKRSIIFPEGNKILFIPISGSGCSKILPSRIN